jgi:E3 ubiquitin-protein ligase HERC2
VVDVACGGAHSAAITASGELYTWGKGRYGRLGHGDSDDQLKPKLVEALLGNGRAKNSLPVLFCVFPVANCLNLIVLFFLSFFLGYRVTDVACGSGDAQTCAITDEEGGTVWSWGDGDYGKLGRGRYTSFFKFICIGD